MFLERLLVSGILWDAGYSVRNRRGMASTLSIFFPGMFLYNGFQRVSLDQQHQSSASPRNLNLVEMQILGPHPRPVNLDIVGLGNLLWQALQMIQVHMQIWEPLLCTMKGMLPPFYT